MADFIFSNWSVGGCPWSVVGNRKEGKESHRDRRSCGTGGALTRTRDARSTAEDTSCVDGELLRRDDSRVAAVVKPGAKPGLTTALAEPSPQSRQQFLFISTQFFCFGFEHEGELRDSRNREFLRQGGFSKQTGIPSFPLFRCSPEFQCESNRKISINASHIEESISVKALCVNYYLMCMWVDVFGLNRFAVNRRFLEGRPSSGEN
jgi:hypothetical protein